ncbi:MAG: hypothetical protein JWP57_3382 [Spirosoma sp.]|nr:hypothetical protein [Spirosoma sp.]
MAHDQHAANLVDTTVNAFNGDTTSISAMDGISLIDTWSSALQDGGQDTESVTNSLKELRSELQSGNPDGARIQQILEDMVDQIKQIAKSADADVKPNLNSLAEALKGFSKQLGGSSKMASMNKKPSDTTMPGESGGRAPMTSTVGGDSTNSGAGLGGGDDYSSNSGHGSSGGRSQY